MRMKFSNSGLPKNRLGLKIVPILVPCSQGRGVDFYCVSEGILVQVLSGQYLEKEWALYHF